MKIINSQGQLPQHLGAVDIRLANAEIARLEHRIYAMTGLLDEAMRIFSLYVNVPEVAELRARWEKLKGETSKESNQCA